MEFRDLGKQYHENQSYIDSSIERVVESGRFIGGAEVEELERALAKYAGVNHCISCANGTDALQLALMSWEVGPGDAVFVPDFTFFSTGEVVSTLGATPVFVDVDADTFNMDAASLEASIEYIDEETDLTAKAVIPVDLYGLPADYPSLCKVCREHEMLILEDAAQGFGGSIGAQKAASFGDAGATSFFPAKPLGCYGDGGAVFTDDDEWASLIRSLAIHGKGAQKYDNIRIGMNSRLDSIQAAILKTKLSAFEAHEVDDVNAIASLYTEHLADISRQTGTVLPAIPDGYTSSWAQYTIQLPNNVDRDKLQRELADENIPTMVYYPKPMHEQLAFKDGSICIDGCPVTKRLCGTVLSLPMGPYMTEEDVDTVCRAINIKLNQ